MRQIIVTILGFLCIVAIEVAIAMAAGCTPMQVQSWKDCEAGHLPASAEALLVDVTSLLYSAELNWQQAMIDLAAKVGKAQFDCAVAAIKGRLEPKVSLKGQLGGRDIVARERAAQWLSGSIKK